MIKPIIILSISIISGVIGQLFLKKGGFNLPELSFSNIIPILKEILRNSYLLSWFALGAISAFTWMLAVSKFELSFVFPFNQALTFILVVYFSSIFFHEAISPLRWLGILFVIIGIFLITK